MFLSTEMFASNGRMILDDELEWMWMEAVLSCFKVILQSLFEGTEKNHKICSQDSLSVDQELKLEHLKLEA
jgi:hypothetical protein